MILRGIFTQSAPNAPRPPLRHGGPRKQEKILDAAGESLRDIIGPSKPKLLPTPLKALPKAA